MIKNGTLVRLKPEVTQSLLRSIGIAIADSENLQDLKITKIYDGGQHYSKKDVQIRIITPRRHLSYSYNIPEEWLTVVNKGHHLTNIFK